MKNVSFPFVALVLLTAVVSSVVAQTVYPGSGGERRGSASPAPGPTTLQRIEFEGLNAFSEADMLTAFSERGIALSQTRMPSSEVLSKAVALIRELLETRGHFHATVATRQDEDAGSVRFMIDEGPRLALAEVRFTGNRRFASSELGSKLGECLARYPSMQVGYEANIFDYCSRELANFVRGQGYLQATLGQPKKEFDGPGVVLTIPIDEGVLYRVGEINIVGAKAVATERVREMLSLRQGDIAQGDVIGKWLFEDLKKTYGEIGYIEYTADADPEFKAAAAGTNEGVVDFGITIEEGHQFRVHAIRFKGSTLPERELLGLLRLRGGDIYNERLFEESINQLNKSGRFELIDKDRDADFRTDKEEPAVDIVIKLTPKMTE